MNVINELKKGNISFIDNMNNEEKKYTFELIEKSPDKDIILDAILPRLYDDLPKYHVNKNIFDLIYCDNKYRDYVYYMLHKKYISIDLLKKEQVKNILEETTWGFDFIIDNFEEFALNIDAYNIINYTVDYALNNNRLNIVADKVLSINEQRIKDIFIMNIIRKEIINKELIIKALYKNIDEYDYKQESMFIEEEPELVESKIPEYIYLRSKDKPELKEILLDNYQVLIKSATKKISIIKRILDCRNDITDLDKYKNLVRLYELYEIGEFDQILSNIIKYNKINELNEMLENKKIKKLSRGSTTIPFVVGNEVLKFTLHKHSTNKIPKLFLIAPTQEEVVRNERGMKILTIEKQKYLKQANKKNNITKEDITRWLEELNKLGYVTTDPHNLNKESVNFGLLDDYHDANLGDYKNYEELPEWFKEKPIVLYDLDLIYEKDNDSKLYFKTH